ncbi:MAG TPA: hypothetical protein VHB21_25550 [Minicystis sp.]|nr:hypothetical protein [Minicystis sp.]
MKARTLVAGLITLLAVPAVASAQEPPPGPPPDAPPPAALPPVPPPPPPPPGAILVGPVAQQVVLVPDERPPSSGVGLLVGGGILTGLGAINLAASIPICHSNLYGTLTPKEQDTCAVAAMTLSGAVTAAGVVMLIVGAGKRSAYNAWRAQHPVASGFGLQPTAGGAGLGWSAKF